MPLITNCKEKLISLTTLNCPLFLGDSQKMTQHFGDVDAQITRKEFSVQVCIPSSCTSNSMNNSWSSCNRYNELGRCHFKANRMAVCLSYKLYEKCDVDPRKCLVIDLLWNEKKWENPTSVSRPICDDEWHVKTHRSLSIHIVKCMSFYSLEWCRYTWWIKGRL